VDWFSYLRVRFPSSTLGQTRSNSRCRIMSVQKIYKRLKAIHPDLKCIEFDDSCVLLRFHSGSFMEAQEFESYSETYELMVELENILLV
jgi:regulator of sigma D